jgi:AraC family transcriptional regulator
LVLSGPMTQILPDRFEDGPARLMGGVRQHHSFATAARDIPGQWMQLHSMGLLPGPVEDVSYGIVCQTNVVAGTFEYMAASEVPSFDDVPEGGRLRLPAAHYAVFNHPGDISTLRETFAAIWQWLPASGWRAAPTPNFERYGPGYDPVAKAGDIEVWIAVAPAEA